MAKASSSGWSSVLVGGAETIVARGSGPGRGALGVVRVSGPSARSVAAAVCPGLDFSEPWRARLVEFIGVDGEAIERGIGIPYQAPKSYTGEDMVEAMVHGSPHLLDAIIDAFIGHGARPAQPGEFTRRAVANGKMDLVQAEAVRDLIAAETARQAENARRQLAGRLSHEFVGLHESLLTLLARVEGAVDFPADGVVFDRRDFLEQRDRCEHRIASLLDTAVAGERIRDGVRVAIVGPPNSGKSTLFNRLVGSERAIVTQHPGTTRDVIEAELEIDGLRIVLADTAGLRATEDPIEREGVRRTQEAISMAQVVVELWPADEPAKPRPARADGYGDGVVIVRVRSKADLVGPEEDDTGTDWIPVSCVTLEGVDALRRGVRNAVRRDVHDLGDTVAIAARHKRILERTAAELAGADEWHPELAAEAIRMALREVACLTGEATVDDVLDEVFQTFCIGK